jgi:carbon-monoxide dehydrogenase medium subunit
VAEAMPHIGHRAIRNRGTACGSLAHADPAAELPAVAVALDATLVLRSAERERSVAASDFFTGYLTTVAEPDELLVECRLPAGSASSGWSVQEISRRHGDFALLGCAASVAADRVGRVSAAALAFFGAANIPVRVPEAEDLLVGQELSEDLFVEAAAAVQKALDPPGDLHASVAHRRHLGAVLTTRCLRQATSRLEAAA